MDRIIELWQAVGTGDLIGLSIVTFITAAAAWRLLPDKQAEQIEQVEKVEQAKPVVVEPAEVRTSFKDRLTRGLSRSRSEIWGKIGNLFGARKLDQSLLDEIEELLYSADLGPKMVQELLEELERTASGEELSQAQFKSTLLKFLETKMNPVQELQKTSLYEVEKNQGSGPRVIMIVGVNGAGKTTTIGKLATKLTRQGAKVVVGACDTFRAAAVDQLEVWCERAGASMVRAKEGANPSGVGFDALQQAMNSGADYCLLDTAGRLHTKENLMDELKKSKAVLAKLMPEAPHEVLLVLDAITGQNALRQAQEFHKTLGLTGLIFTKCDGSSKAGSAIGIVNDLNVPLSFIGVGEGVDDLDQFNLEQYLKALIDWEQTVS
jgi:fused signal recognition particle receptor